MPRGNADFFFPKKNKTGHPHDQVLEYRLTWDRSSMVRAGDLTGAT